MYQAACAQLLLEGTPTAGICIGKRLRRLLLLLNRSHWLLLLLRLLKRTESTAGSGLLLLRERAETSGKLLRLLKLVELLLLMHGRLLKVLLLLLHGGHRRRLLKQRHDVCIAIRRLRHGLRTKCRSKLDSGCTRRCHRWWRGECVPASWRWRRRVLRRRALVPLDLKHSLIRREKRS